jgi:hypothetical protein
LNDNKIGKTNQSGQHWLFCPVLVLEECPFCHKFLAAELITKQEIDTADMLKEKDVFYKLGVPIETGVRIADNPEMFVTYKLGFKCRQCGKEWSKVKVEGITIPKETAEAESEESDYDTEMEEQEEAREEQYAEE